MAPSAPPTHNYHRRRTSSSAAMDPATAGGSAPPTNTAHTGYPARPRMVPVPLPFGSPGPTAAPVPAAAPSPPYNTGLRTPPETPVNPATTTRRRTLSTAGPPMPMPSIPQALASSISTRPRGASFAASPPVTPAPAPPRRGSASSAARPPFLSVQSAPFVPGHARQRSGELTPATLHPPAYPPRSTSTTPRPYAPVYLPVPAAPYAPTTPHASRAPALAPTTPHATRAPALAPTTPYAAYAPPTTPRAARPPPLTPTARTTPIPPPFPSPPAEPGITLNPTLRQSGYLAVAALPLVFDVAAPSFSAAPAPASPYNPAPLAPSLLAEQAFFPAPGQAGVTVAFPGVPWPLDVVLPPGGLTAHELLRQVHRKLGRPVPPDMLDACPDEMQARANAAFRARLRTGTADARMRRFDFLDGATRFAGLRPARGAEPGMAFEALFVVP